MPAPKYSQETVTRAAELRELGMPKAAIARQLGMSVGAVDYHTLRLGADVPPDRQYPLGQRGPDSMRRGNHVVRRFSAEEDNRLLEMEATGIPLSEIARALGRKRNSVAGRLMTLARHEERQDG